MYSVDDMLAKAYRDGYEQAKKDSIAAVRECYYGFLDVTTDGHTIADSVEDIITERVIVYEDIEADDLSKIM